MPYYCTYPHCKSNLDPGETCDCTKANASPAATSEASKEPRACAPIKTYSFYHSGAALSTKTKGAGSR